MQIPLSFQTFDYNAGKFVKAIVYKQDGTEVGRVNLTAGIDGWYFDDSMVYPSTELVIEVQYLVFDDAGYTVLSTSEGAGGPDYLYKNLLALPPSSAIGVTTNIIGFIDSDVPPVPPYNNLEDIIVTNCARTLAMRLVTDQNFSPFDISSASEISVRFMNQDGTVLQVNSSDPGAPVQIISGPAGSLICILTSVQTRGLMTQTPAPFSVLVTLDTGLIVVNFPFQLSVVAQSV